MNRILTAATLALATVATPVLADSVGPRLNTQTTDLVSSDMIQVTKGVTSNDATGYFESGLNAVNATAVRILTQIANEDGTGYTK